MNFDLIFRHIRPNNLIDIGANVGNFTTSILSKIPDCKCHMIEANPNCEYFLKKNSVPYTIIALSRQKDEANLFIEKKNIIATGASLYLENTQFYSEGKFETIKVKTDTLDSLEIFGEESIDLVKIDVQGSELDILYGGEKTFKRTSYVLVELSMVEYNINAPLMPEIVEKLREYDFKVHEIVDFLTYGNQVLQTDILFKKISN